MTGYSGGARWMGIVSRRDPEPPPALSRMTPLQAGQHEVASDALAAIRRVLESRLRSARRRCEKSGHKGDKAREELALLVPALAHLQLNPPRVSDVIAERFLNGTPVPMRWRRG